MKHLIRMMAVLLCLSSCTAQTEKPKNMEKRVLVAYFSATGTTKKQAQTIAQTINADLYEISPKQAYTEADLDWRDKQSRSSVEMADEKSRPELGGKQIDASTYDVVFIGFPIWWYVCPRVVNTWIESQRLEGKEIILFATSGSSTIDNSLKVLRQTYKNLNFREGKLLNCKENETVNWVKEVITK